MGMLKTLWDVKTVQFRPSLQKRITDEMLFDMPTMGLGPAVILGATRATALVAAAAVEAGHRSFFVIGGKEVGDEDPRFTRLLTQSLEKAGLPLPSDSKMKECEYAQEVLRNHFGVTGRIIIKADDRSTNLQENLEAMSAGYAKLDGLEFYTLAGTARRVIGTARKVFNNDTMAIAAHNVFPTGITRENWMQDTASSFYAISEADKVLSKGDKTPEYERRGFCRPVDLTKEIARVEKYIAQRNLDAAGPKADGPK
jgi:hypothetical protein